MFSAAFPDKLLVAVQIKVYGRNYFHRIGLEINSSDLRSHMLEESLWDTTVDYTVEFSLRKHMLKPLNENQEAAIEELKSRGLNSH